jgi:hypothetical protein
MGRLSKHRFGIARPGVVVAVVAFGLVVGGCGGSASGNSEKSEKKTESPQKFLDKLNAAVRKGQTDVRVALLHPAVIERYGEQQCRDFLATPEAQDTTRKDKVQRVDKPKPFEFTTDDGALPIPNAQFVLVQETYQGKKSRRELHLARVDGEYRYFIDCGTPLPRP